MRPDDPPPEELSYAEAVRRHPAVVIGIAVLAILAGVLWLALRSPGYEAGAEILVAPVPAEEEAFVGIDVVHESGDATRTVQTAVSLLHSPAAAAGAATALGPPWTSRKVERTVRVEPQGESSVVVVTARAGSGAGAVHVANAYATAALSARDREVSRQIRARIAALDQRIGVTSPGNPAAVDLATRRDTLSAAGDGDPSLSLAQRAVPPASRTGAPAVLVLALIAAIGIVIGVATAVALEELGRRGHLRVGRSRAGETATPWRLPRPATARAGGAPAETGDDAWLLEALRRAISEAGPDLSEEAFDDWRRTQPAEENGATRSLPTASAIARRFGGWSRARARATGSGVARR